MSSTSESKRAWILSEEARKDQKKLEDNYILGNSIGTAGQFGEAYLVQHKTTKERFAVKVISKNKFSNNEDLLMHFEQLEEEIKIMKQMKHTNIIAIKDVMETSGHLYIVMECCEGGELFDRIQELGSFTEAGAQGVLRDIITGLQYMHGLKLAHCDLKPDNFLFLTQAPDAVLKIIDFGMSKHVGARSFLSERRGTTYYMAPDVLAGKYNESCDIWSFGVVMFVMLFGYPPFHANTDEAIFKKIKRGFNPTVKKGYGAFFPASIPISEDAKDLIAKCLQSDATTRFTATECLQHRFLNSEQSSKPLAHLISNLKEFKDAENLRNKVVAMMVSQLMSPEDEKRTREEFKAMDTDGSGGVSPAEMAKFFEGKLTKEEATTYFRNADIDGDGQVSADELIQAATRSRLVAKEERLWSAFCKIDSDGDGTASIAELCTFMQISEAEAKTMISAIDDDKNGNIDFDEFKQLFINIALDPGVKAAAHEQGSGLKAA